MARLSLYDFRDLDLMMRVHEAGDNEGWLSSQELAEALGMEDDIRAVASRARWMREFGMFDFDDEKRLWRLSAGGERVVKAKVRAAATKQVDAVPDESMIDIMSHVTTRYRHGDPMMATMLRREFAFGTSPRSVIWNGKRRR